MHSGSSTKLFNEWSPMIGYAATDETPQTTDFDRPDFIGIVSGAQYKLENCDDVTEFALVILLEGNAFLYEASSEDLKYLGRQIKGLVGE